MSVSSLILAPAFNFCKNELVKSETELIQYKSLWMESSDVAEQAELGAHIRGLEQHIMVLRQQLQEVLDLDKEHTESMSVSEEVE